MVYFTVVSKTKIVFCFKLCFYCRLSMGLESKSHALSSLDGVSPSVFRCTSTPMETGPIVTCGET